MTRFWLEPLLCLLGLALAGLLAWAIWDETVGALVVAGCLLAVVVVQLVYLRRMQRWLDDPGVASVPEGWGAWSTAFSALYRVRRRDDANSRALASALQRFRDMASALPDGVVLLDRRMHIDWCNAAAEAHFGIELARDRGLLFTHIARHPVLVDFVDRGSGSMPVTIHARGQTLSLQWIPFGAATDGERMLLSRDVGAMDGVQAMRREFIANVSHELRTPLTVLNGFLEMLDDDGIQDPATTKRHHQRMREQITAMTRLIEDLLTLSRLESESLVAPDTIVDMAGLLDTLADELRALSAGRHSLEFDIDRSLQITGSERELMSAFGNVAGNAIRYTKEGGTIAIRWAEEGSQAVLTVRDTGIGIAKEHIPRLTERFYRVDPGRSRASGGTGLGLAIVKHVLVRHQARLDVASQPAGGSVFRLVFPARRVQRTTLPLDLTIVAPVARTLN